MYFTFDMEKKKRKSYIIWPEKNERKKNIKTRATVVLLKEKEK